MHVAYGRLACGLFNESLCVVKATSNSRETGLYRNLSLEELKRSSLSAPVLLILSGSWKLKIRSQIQSNSKRRVMMRLGLGGTTSSCRSRALRGS